MDYERIGRFIYGACRHGADRTDICNWMADDLSIARPNPGDEVAASALYTAFSAKYASDDEFQANYARFLEKLTGRNTQE